MPVVICAQACKKITEPAPYGWVGPKKFIVRFPGALVSSGHPSFLWFYPGWEESGGIVRALVGGGIDEGALMRP